MLLTSPEDQKGANSAAAARHKFTAVREPWRAWAHGHVYAELWRVCIGARAGGTTATCFHGIPQIVVEGLVKIINEAEDRCSARAARAPERQVGMGREFPRAHRRG
jgi:hypothetical protein